MVTVVAVYVQNACCTDIHTQRFLSECLIAVGTIIACKILHTNAVSVCLHFVTSTCTFDCLLQLWNRLLTAMASLHCSLLVTHLYFLKCVIAEQYCYIVCELWPVQSLLIPKLYTQLLPFLLLSAFPPHCITKYLLTDVDKQNVVEILDVCHGDVQDFSLVWLPVLIPSFGCFMTVPVNLNETRWRWVSLLHCPATVQNA
jgi:hypothetical protein